MEEKFLMKGNEALAEAAIQAGCRHFFGYPITPQTELAAYMAKRMPQVGGTYLQAESEIAAANMVLGAAGSGVRAMTSSSSPGISLKSEAISYMAACDIPALIVNVQRGGPGLGGIQPSQADYWQATKATGHGDFQILVLAPDSIQEMVDLVGLAFDKGDEYRIPVMLLADGMLGQMMEPVKLPENGENTKNIEKPWACCGHKNKRKHNILNSLLLSPDELEALIIERYKRYDLIIENEQRWEEYLLDDAEIVVVAFGSSARVAHTAIDEARKQGIKVGMLRPITLWPYPYKAFKTLKNTAKAFLTVEMNMGQMVEDVKLAVECKKPVYFVGRTGGEIPRPMEVLNKIIEIGGIL